MLPPLLLAVMLLSLMTPASPLLDFQAAAEAANEAAPLSNETSFQVSPHPDYGTYFGGDRADMVERIALGPDGGVYLMMSTTSSDLPVNASSYQSTKAGRFDIYVCKLNSNGTALLHSTYIGGNDNDFPLDMAVDDDGCAYIVGYTSSADFPTTAGSFQPIIASGMDGFVVKLSADASRLEFSTYLGGWQGANVYDVVWDPVSDACVVAGRTGSTDFPTTSGAYDPRPSSYGDAFVTGFSADGSSLRFSTFLGGDNTDEAKCLGLADNGDLLVGGRTRSSDFPTTAGALQGTRAGFYDCVVSRLDADASDLLSSTYLGGSSNESCERIAEGHGGCIVAAGATTSDDFPSSQDAADASLGGSQDAFVAILDEDLGTLEYGSYIGGTGFETMDALVVDPQGDIYLSGSTNATDFPESSDPIQPDPTPGGDIYLHVLDPSGTGVLLSSYVGGDSSDVARSLALDMDGNLYLAGWTASSDFWVSGDAYQYQHASPGGGYDSILMIIDDLAPPSVDAGADKTIDQHMLAYFSGQGTRDNDRYLSWEWTFLDGLTPVELLGKTDHYTFHEAGLFPVTLKVTDTTGNWATDIVNVTVNDTTPPTAVIVANATVDQGQALALDGTASTDNVGVTGWRWTVRDEDGPYMLSGPTASYVFASAGSFQVSLNATDAALNWAVAVLNVTVRDTEPPTAVAGGDIEVGQGEGFVLNGSASADNVGIVNWTWTAGEGDSGTVLGYGPVLELSLPDAGALAVKLTVRDAEGNAAVDTLALLVLDTTPPVARAGEDIGVDQHTSVVLDGSASTDNVGIVQWTWTMSTEVDDILLGSGGVVEHVFNDAGHFTIILTVMDATGRTGDDELELTVRDTDPPVAEAGPDVTVDQLGDVTLDGSGSTDNVGVVVWEWTVDFDVLPTPFPPLVGMVRNFTFLEAGTHNVQLMVRDLAGNRANDTLTVTVRDTEPPSPEAGPDVATDQNLEVRLDGRASGDNVGITNWTWRVTVNGSLVVLHGPQAALVIDTPGAYEVTLEVRDMAGNSAVDRLNVTVNDSTAPLAVAPPDMSARRGIAVILNGSACSDNVGVVNWTWAIDTGEGVVNLHGREVSFAFKRAGDHTVTLTVRDSAGNEAEDVLQVVVAGEEKEKDNRTLVIVLFVVIAAVAGIAFYLRGRDKA